MSRLLAIALLPCACSVADYTAQAVKEKVIREEIVPELRKPETRVPSNRKSQECEYVRRGGLIIKECR